MKVRNVIVKKCRLALVSILGSLLLPMSLCGQGTVDFCNFVPISDVDGVTPLAGPAFLAQLYAGAPGQSLRPVGVPRPFLTGTDAGYFDCQVVVVPGVLPGGTAVVQVVAWRASDGLTFEAANHPGGHAGQSNVFLVGPLSFLYGPPPPPPDPGLDGLQSFSLQVVVPEPSVFALGLLGGAFLALGRRRHRAPVRVKITPVPPSPSTGQSI